jgi:hypothetical protein
MWKANLPLSNRYSYWSMVVSTATKFDGLMVITINPY